MHTEGGVTESVRPPLCLLRVAVTTMNIVERSDFFGASATARKTMGERRQQDHFQRITIPDPPKIEPRFMVNCRVCKSLDKSGALWNGQMISGIERLVVSTLKDLVTTEVYISRGRKNKINHEWWIIFVSEVIVVLKLSESKAAESRPHSKAMTLEGPINLL